MFYANPKPSFSLTHSLTTTKPKSQSLRIRNSKPTLWNVDEIAQAVNGRIVKRGPPGTISIDTRTINPNQWLFAISGKNFNAHDFVTTDLSIAGVIGNRVCSDWDKGFVEISGDTVESLTAMACYARKRFHGTVIGVTGSVGKTTTRSMIATALESLGSSVYQTYGNFNNTIGVSLTLIGMPRDCDGDGIAVVELGISSRGEMLGLARMVEPRVSVVTNVVPSHLGNFGCLEEIAKEKGEIMREAIPGDVCVLNADDPLVMGLSVPPGVQKVLFGRREGCDVRLVDAQPIDGGYGVRVILEKNGSIVEIPIRSPGLHLAMNACAAAAVATHLGVPLEKVGTSLSAFTPVDMRAKIQVLGNGMRIVNDVYNASPVPMKCAIDLLSSLECHGKRVAVLGDMIQTGPDEVRIHQAVLENCLDAGVDLIGIVGNRFLAAARNMNMLMDTRFVVALNKESLAEEIVKRVGCEDVVLVKGARVMEMEKFVDLLVEAMEKTTAS